MTVSIRAFAGCVLAASAAVLGTALLSQYWGGLAPCELCLLQRWPWTAAIVISLVAVLAGRGRASRCRMSDSVDLERPPYLPGDPPPEAEIARMIRVDHAGEYGAVRIYDGQLAVMGRGRARDAVRRMAEQEQHHLAAFVE